MFMFKKVTNTDPRKCDVYLMTEISLKFNLKKDF